MLHNYPWIPAFIEIDTTSSPCIQLMDLWQQINDIISLNIYSYTQHTFLQLFITWQLVLTPNMGHHQASIQEHECIQKLNTIKLEISHFHIKNSSFCVHSYSYIMAWWWWFISGVRTSCQVINNCKSVRHVWLYILTDIMIVIPTGMFHVKKKWQQTLALK